MLGRFAPIVIDAFTRAIPAIWIAEDARKEGHESSLLTAAVAVNSILFFLQMLMIVYSFVRICAGGTL